MYFSPCVAPHLNPLSLHLYCEFLIFLRACAHLFSHAQSYPTLCVPMDCSLPGFDGHGIFQARITKAGCHFLLQGIFLTKIMYLVSPTLAVVFFTTEESRFI